MEIASGRAEVSQKSADLARLAAEKQQAVEGWEKEVAARMLAESSEKKALQAATKQVGGARRVGAEGRGEVSMEGGMPGRMHA